MNKKYIVIGGSFAGISFATRIKRLLPESKVQIYEKTEDIAYNSCAIPFYIANEVEKKKNLFNGNKKSFKNYFNLDMFPKTEAVAIDKENRSVQFKNLKTNEIFEESYDYLILATGSKVIVPNIPGIKQNHIFTIKDLENIKEMKTTIENSKDIVIIGGSIVGTEILESIPLENKKVTVIEESNQIITDFDKDLVQIAQKEILEKGIELLLEEKVVEITKNFVKTQSGQEISADTIILALGEIGDVDLGKEAGLEIGECTSYKIDKNYKTSDDFIFAIGNNIEVEIFLSGKK